MRKITNKNEALNELIRGKENIYYVGDETALNEYIRISKDSLNMLITSVIESEAARRGCLDIYTLLSGQEETKGEKERRCLEIADVLIIYDIDAMSQSDFATLYTRKRMCSRFPRLIIVGDVLGYIGTGSNYYSSPIQAGEWDSFAFTEIDLRKKRLDIELEEKLESLRMGDKSVISWLNANCKAGDEPIKLVMSTHKAYEYALQCYDKSKKYRSEYEGEIKGNFYEEDMPTFQNLSLYMGQRIMFVDDDPNGSYMRGDIGYITGLYTGEVHISLNEQVIKVRAVTWHKYKPDYIINELFEDELIMKDVSEFSQLPIIPADMISYRMSRGVRFESIEFSPITKYDGEFYNYISHAKSHNGIKLTAKISEEDVKINTDIIECYLDS